MPSSVLHSLRRHSIPGALHALLVEKFVERHQVEKAIFKIHTHLLTTQLDVFDDMLSTPKDEFSSNGTDHNPLVLVGGAIAGWELLLSSMYRS
jgi:hypothetical protein